MNIAVKKISFFLCLITSIILSGNCSKNGSDCKNQSLPSTEIWTSATKKNCSKALDSEMLLLTGLGVGTTTGAPAGASAPPSLYYSNSTFVFTKNSTITTQTPSSSGTITSCTSSPSLPTGLTINNSTCAISGAPTVEQIYTNHTITASNSSGNATASITITVTPFIATTGSMIVARKYHFSALLNTGKVLIAGGTNSASVDLSSAELYDPSTGLFTNTGSMSAVRAQYARSALLVNGKVLITGGWYVNTSDIYDPSTGLFTTTGNLNIARGGFSLTALANGKALIVGGAAGASELYDPSTGLFTTTGTMLSNPNRSDHTATLLSNGKVLVVGGWIGSATAGAELYDPTTGLYTATGSLNTARYRHTAVMMSNGKVLIVGGQSSNTSAEIYDPSSGTFSMTGSTVSSLDSRGTLTSLTNGKVLLAGYGAQVYDPTTGVFTKIAESYSNSYGGISRYNHAATIINTSKILISGGVYSGDPTAVIYLQ